MIKLGFHTEEKEQNLKKQGEFLAANQLKESLHFIFLEEASLPKLNGPKYNVIRKKIAFTLSQLKKTNYGASHEEIEKIKDNAYLDMYGLIKEELLQLREVFTVHKHPSISKKIKHLQAIIDRIMSNIQIPEFPESIKNLMAPVNDQLVSESA